MPIRLAVVGSSEVARKGAPKLGAVEKLVQPHDHGHGGAEGQKRQDTDTVTHEIDRRRGNCACGQALTVGAEPFQKRVLQRDGQPERHQKRRQDIGAQRPVQQMLLQ
jgi:hypothetical protein